MSTSEKLSNMFRAIQPGLGQALQYSINKEMEASLAKRQENLLRLRQKHEAERDERRYTEAEKAREDSQTFQKELFGAQTEAADTRAAASADLTREGWDFQKDMASDKAFNSMMSDIDKKLFDLNNQRRELTAGEGAMMNPEGTQAAMAEIEAEAKKLQEAKAVMKYQQAVARREAGDPTLANLDEVSFFIAAGIDPKTAAEMAGDSEGPPSGPKIEIGTDPLRAQGGSVGPPADRAGSELVPAQTVDTPVPAQSVQQPVSVATQPAGQLVPAAPPAVNAAESGQDLIAKDPLAATGQQALIPGEMSMEQAMAQSGQSGGNTEMGNPFKPAMDAVKEFSDNVSAKKRAAIEEQARELVMLDASGERLTDKQFKMLSDYRKIYPELMARIESEMGQMAGAR